jgi:hypothetical protein
MVGKGGQKFKIMFNEKNITQRLRHIARGLKFNKEKKCTNAFMLLSDPQILRSVYETIKSHPGNMVHGSNNETLDGISET